MDEKVVIEEIRNGNQQQLAVIYRTYRSEFIAWLTSNYQCTKEEAKDVYQVSIMTLHENILNNKLQQLKSNIKTYLFAIGKNKIHEFRRNESRYERRIEVSTIELEELATWEAVDKERRLQMMEISLDKLGDPCKTLLELYYFHGLSMEEIAEKVGYKNKETAKNLKCKCITRLRRIFIEESKTASIEMNGNELET